MHYLGFVFVKEPTREAVAAALEDFEGDEWDWYRCGGRWDGYLQGQEEMDRRKTDNGFNFADENDDPARNSCKVSEMPSDIKTPHFFVSKWDFVPKTYYNKYERSPHNKESFGAILDTPYFAERYARALKDNAENYLVVVDIHN